MTLQTFIATAWNDHGEQPAEVAERLAESLAMAQTPDDIAAYARLVTHVYGEHLHRWSDGVALLRALQERTGRGDNAPAAPAVVRSIAVLQYASGEEKALDGIDTGDRIAVLAMASSALLGASEFARARDAFRSAIALAGDNLPPDSPAIRALASNSNNMAAALADKPQRSSAETEFMVEAARAALHYWQRCGTWLEEQRAEYRLASSLLLAGAHSDSKVSASRCIELCRRHGAPPFEQFFGHAILALAQRAAGDQAAFAESRNEARAAYANVEPADQRWCATHLAELGPTEGYANA